MNVFIIGIAGGTGSRVAKRLAAKGDTVRGLCRRPEQIADLKGFGATGTIGDIATIADQQLAAAAAGADAIVFSAGAGESDDESMVDQVDGDGILIAIAAARIAKISRVLMVSVFPEAWRERHLGKGFEHYITAKKRADVALAHSDLDWLIVRPSALKDDPGTGTVRLSPAEIHVDIARDDVAATIVAVLHTPSLHKRILEVTAGDTPIARPSRLCENDRCCCPT